MWSPAFTQKGSVTAARAAPGAALLQKPAGGEHAWALPYVLLSWVSSEYFHYSKTREFGNFASAKRQVSAS